MTALAGGPRAVVARALRDGVQSPSLVGIGFLWIFAELGSVQKYTGTAPALVVLALTPVAAMAAGALFALAEDWTWRVSPDVVAAAVCCIAIVAFLVIYPHANTHVDGSGTDRDDAATIGARGFLHGDNPYGTRTYLGNPISQLPALLVVAMPFVGLFGSSAYELVLWIPLLYLLWRALASRPALALVALALGLCSPAVLRDVLTGGDLVPNVVLVAGAMWLAWRWAGSGPLELAGAVLLGFALSSRANYLFVLVPLLLGIRVRHGAAAAVRVGVAALVVAAAVTLPFALTHGGREALSMNDKLSELPGGSVLVLVVGLVVALLLATRAAPQRLASVFAQATAVQLLFVIALVLARSVQNGRPDFFWLISGYGAPTLLFGLTALVAP